MKKMAVLCALPVLAGLGGCGTVNNALATKQTTTEYFRVYNIKTDASMNAIADAASNGIGKDINGMHSAYPINTSGNIPDKPGYMHLVDPFKNSPLGALAGSAGSVGFKVASCDGAVWTSKAQSYATDAPSKDFSLCLFPYKGGYQLDIYGALTTTSGGLMQIDRNIVSAALGSPKQFMEKAFNDTITSIHQAVPNASISFVRGEPAPGPLPWKLGRVLGQ